ncbi:MAG: hypothetical protein IKS96_04070 [Fibrobacter sp.]|nr:hypothetical protein [Fibrobacter sp.]
MNKVIISAAMSLMLLSTSAMALTININKKKNESERVTPPSPQPPPPPTPSQPTQPPPPPPPPPVPAKQLVTCKFAEPKCDRQDRVQMERYQNEQQMYSFGQCIRGEKERNYNFYCTNGDIWMRIDFRRNQADRIECYDPRQDKFFVARSIGECEKINRNLNDRNEVRTDVLPARHKQQGLFRNRDDR